MIYYSLLLVVVQTHPNVTRSGVLVRIYNGAYRIGTTMERHYIRKCRSLQEQRVDEFVVHTKSLTLRRRGNSNPLLIITNYLKLIEEKLSIHIYYYTIKFFLSSSPIVRNSHPSFGFGRAIIVISTHVGILLAMQAHHWDSRNIFFHFIISHAPLHNNDE